MPTKETAVAKIRKDIFLNTLFCPTYGWLSRSSSPTKPSLFDKMRMEEGIEIHQKARELSPNGIFVEGDNQTTSKFTKKLLGNKEVDVIFEGTFIAGDYITKADILKRKGNKWNLTEIKSATNKDAKYIDDIAYTYTVSTKAGLKVDTCSLLLVSKDFRLGMGIEKLFEENDVTEAVLERAVDFSFVWEQIAQILGNKNKPLPELKWECRSCEYYTDCHKSDRADTIFELPYCNASKFEALSEIDVLYIRDIPSSVSLSQYQQRVVKAVSSGKVVVDKEALKNDLESIIFPAFYLDFETMSTCIPLYSDIAPYTQIPTQYSIHVCSAPGKIVNHYEYLADHKKDCRRELAERLIGDCGNRGSIITYTGFEQRIIKGLIDIFSDVEGELNGLLDRIVDLHQIIRNNYYDPAFHGSTSIKTVLPVMVPDLSYEGMSIADGGDAMAVFTYMVKGYYEEDQIEQLRRDLLKYCKLDTLAMVRLHENLKGLS